MERLPDLQAAVRALDGVAWASVVWPDPTAAATLHVAFDPGADAERVTRQVLAVLEDVAGVEPGMLEVRATGPGAESGVARAPRPAFTGLIDAGAGVPAAVAIRYGDRLVRADVAGAAAEPRAAAEAALAALQQLLPDGASAELDWLQVLTAPLPGRPELVQVAVTLRTGVVAEHHVGVAAVRTDPAEAAVRATLDAITRRVEPILPPVTPPDDDAGAPHPPS